MHRRLRRAMPSRDPASISIVDVTDDDAFALLPPCADPGFDHRSCDYWEDADRGSKAARLDWLAARPPPATQPVAAPAPARQPVPRRPRPSGQPTHSRRRAWRRGRQPVPRRTTTRAGRQPVRAAPCQPAGRRSRCAAEAAAPRSRTRRRRVVREGAAPRRRAGRLLPVRAAVRVPARPADPRPVPGPARRAVARGDHVYRDARRPPAAPGLATALVEAVCEDLGRRGFAAVETYPEVGARPDATSAATPGVLGDRSGSRSRPPTTRFPVMRRELA